MKIAIILFFTFAQLCWAQDSVNHYLCGGVMSDMSGKSKKIKILNRTISGNKKYESYLNVSFEEGSEKMSRKIEFTSPNTGKVSFYKDEKLIGAPIDISIQTNGNELVGYKGNQKTADGTNLEITYEVLGDKLVYKVSSTNSIGMSALLQNSVCLKISKKKYDDNLKNWK